MSLPITRIDFRERLRRVKKLRGDSPTDAEIDAFASESIAWWWSLLSQREPSGFGVAIETVVTTPAQSFVLMPSAIRRVRRIERSDSELGPAWYASRMALPYDVDDVVTVLPGVAWIEHRATDGQVIELRPIPDAAITITVTGTGEPPAPWTSDLDTIDLIDELHYRAIIDVCGADILYRDEPQRIADARAQAASSIAIADQMRTEDRPHHWRTMARRHR